MARPGGNPDLKMVRNEDTDSANAKRRALAHAYAMSTAEKLLWTGQSSVDTQSPLCA